MTVDLSAFSNPEFDRGAPKWKEALWLVVSLILFRGSPFCLSPLKRAVLRLFGAQIGVGVTIKPQVKITFPWKLSIGDYAWIGEESWMLNLDHITIGSNVCISQRAFLCTGNHDYTSRTFDLITKPIVVGDGAWIGANSWVGPGVTVGPLAVLAAGSVATKDLDSSGIYSGNPATFRKTRTLK